MPRETMTKGSKNVSLHPGVGNEIELNYQSDANMELSRMIPLD